MGANHGSISLPPQGTSFAVRLKTLLAAFAPVAVVVYVSYLYLDAPVARAARDLFHRGSGGAALPQLPDLLLPVAILVTVAGWGGRFALAGDPMRSRLRDCLTALGFAAPLSYAGKELLKLAFGRIRTREWLLHPHLDGFHWFHGTGVYDGFPSGHMMVLVALGATVWRWYPRTRPALVALLCVLAAALVALDYHFVSDVVAGAYGGLLVSWLAWRLSRAIM